MSTYSNNLRLELITTGDQSGTWGATTNNNLGTLIEQAISGYTTIVATAANQALTALSGVSDQSRNSTLVLTTTTAMAFNIYTPPSPKSYTVYNASSFTGTIYNSTVTGNTTAAGAGVAIPAGKTMTVWSDGTNFAVQNSHIIGTVVGNVTGNLTGNVTGNVAGQLDGSITSTTTAVTQAPGTSNTTVATTAFASSAFQGAYPVGSIYMNATNAANPSTLLGFGTWVSFGTGRVLVGFDAANPLFDTAEETGGSADATTVSHTHSFSATTSTQGAHTHDTNVFRYSDNAGTNPSAANAGAYFGKIFSAGGFGTFSTVATDTQGAHNHTVSGTTGSTGSSGTNANYQPYITVYMWKRTA